MTVYQYAFSCPGVPRYQTNGFLYNISLLYHAFLGKERAYITSFTIQTSGIANIPGDGNWTTSNLFRIGTFSINISGEKEHQIKRMPNRSLTTSASGVIYPKPKAPSAPEMHIILYNSNALTNVVYFKNGDGSYKVFHPGVENADESNPALRIVNDCYAGPSSTSNWGYSLSISDYCEWTKAQVDANPSVEWEDPDKLARLFYNFPEEDNYQSSRKPFDKDFQAPGGLNIPPNVWLFKSTVDDSSWKDAVTRDTSTPVRIHRTQIGGFFDKREDCVYDVPR